MNRLHPLSAAMRALQQGFTAAMLAFFLVTFLTGALDLGEFAWSFVLVPLGFLAGAAYAVAYYKRFAYELTEDTFDLASGVISRRSREIPYRRIQNVDVRQGVLFNLLGMAVVRIETAGGGDTEATLNFVSEAEAERLQREIRRRTTAAKRRRREGTDRTEGGHDEPEVGDRASAGEPGIGRPDERNGPESASAGASRSESGMEDGYGAGAVESESTTDRLIDQPRTLFELAGRELLLYSFASFRPAAAAGLFFLVAFGNEYVLSYLLSVAQPFGGPAAIETGQPGSYLVLTVISFVHAVVVAYVLSALYTFVAYYGFRLGETGGDLVYERGLLQRYSGSIPVEKVQSVTITDNPIQRAIDYAGLWIETAGYGPDSSGESQSAVPLARVERTYRFAERLTDVERPSFSRPTTVARRRYAARYGLVATVFVVLAFALSTVTSIDAWYLAAAAYVLVPPAAHLRWINLGYYLGDDHLVVRSGFWRRRTTVIPYYRIQTISTSRSIFQRRLDLASVVIDTASSQTFSWSTPTVYDVDLAVAHRIHGDSRDRLQSALEGRSSDGESTGPLD